MIPADDVAGRVNDYFAPDGSRPPFEAVKGPSLNSQNQGALAHSLPEKSLLLGEQLFQKKNPMCFLSHSGSAVLIRKPVCVNAWLLFFLISQKSSFDQHHEWMCKVSSLAKTMLRICRRCRLL